MEERSRETDIIVAVIIIVLFVTIVVIGVSVYNIFQSGGKAFFKDETTNSITTFLSRPQTVVDQRQLTEVESNRRDQDYNFVIKQENVYAKSDGTLSYIFAVSDVSDEQVLPEIETGEVDEGLITPEMEAQLVNIPSPQVTPSPEDNINFGTISKVTIPKIGVITNIYQGLDGDQLLKQGWWLYPTSYATGTGEKIFYCHRRFFGRNDPRTCWNMNKLTIDDRINVTNTAGVNFQYKVISVSVVHQSVSNMMIPSDKNYIKIITCGTATGEPGGNDYRVVVLAELVK